MGYWGVNQTQARVAESVYSVAAGATSTDGMESYPRRLTFRSESSLADINYVKHWVRQGVPVIVLQRFDETSETGHYRVVIGYDDNKGEIITYDPIKGERFNLTYGAFAQLWQPGRDILRANWSLVIRPTSDELAALAWHLQTLLNTSPSDDPLVAYVRQELLGDFRAVCSAYVSAMDRASSEESKLLLALVSTAVAGLLIGSAGTLVLCLSRPKK